jgi:hypothetical protein
MHRRRRREALPVGLSMLVLLASMVLPTTAAACLAYEAASNFSFADSLNLAVVGEVTDVLDEGLQDKARVIVAVEKTIAGEPGSTVEVAMDPNGGCTHPSGDIGDEIVIAAGAPGADYGVFNSWSGGYLSPDNAAAWIIGADGSVSGPTLDGRQFASREELEAALRSLPNGANAKPGLPRSILIGWALMVALLAIVAAWFFGNN